MISYPILKENTKVNPLGYGALNNTLSCKVTEKRNDAFYLELKCKNVGDIVDYIKVGRLIEAWTGEELGYQHFRIYDVKKDIKGNIDISAEHVYFDLKKIPVVDKQYLNANIKTILSNLLSKDLVITGHGFTVQTDLNETIDVDFKCSNSVAESILGTEGSVLEGVSTTFELIRSNQEIKVMKSRGKVQNSVISYTKNIDGFKCIENRDTAYTHLFPYAYKKNTSTDANAKDTLITCSPKTVTMWEYEGGAVNVCARDFTNDVVWETKTLNATNLLAHAKKHAKKMQSDPPFKYEVKLSAIKLKSDEELKSIGIGDTFRLFNKMYNITTNVKVTELVVDCLTKTPISVVLEEVI